MTRFWTLIFLLSALGCQPDADPSATVTSDRIYRDLQAEMAGHNSFPFDFRLPSIDGDIISKADFQGQVLIVDIWGTWCPPCRKEIPHFIQLRNTYGKEELAIVGLNYERVNEAQTAINKIKSFRDVNGINYPCLLGDDETAKQIPNFQGFPTTFFIDKQGEIRLTLVGLQPYKRLEAAAQILLQEP